jgi:hypothetical protein
MTFNYVELGSGINESVFLLFLNGLPQGPGTYGSTLSSAAFKNNEYFSGTGIITVLLPEPTTLALMLFGLAMLAGWRLRR